MKKRNAAKRPVHQWFVGVLLATTMLVSQPLSGSLMDGWDFAKTILGGTVGILASAAGPWVGLAAGTSTIAAIDILERGIKEPEPLPSDESTWLGAP